MRRVTILLMALQLNACAIHSSEFECGASRGVGCKSISKVNDMVNEGKINDEEVIKAETLPTNSIAEVTYMPTKINEQKNVYRHPERTARIWISSFTDEKGDYVGETYIYTLLEPGKWSEDVR